ncbi:MAG: bacitracin ABC transporter ATP-binding protein, partial [Nostocales cyanobacterium]
IDGYCVGEPWNYRAALEGSGFTIATDLEVWLGHPAKVLGVREDWANAYPNTHIALTKALLEACQYCADPKNAQEIRQILASREYVSTDIEFIQIQDPDDFTQLPDPDGATCDLAHPMREYAHHQFYGASAINRPSRTEQTWIMTQLARWGETPFPRNWVEIVERVCRVGVFSTAARELGLDISYTRQPIQFFDGKPFNADDPFAYLSSLEIKRDFSVAEVVLDTPRKLAA